MDCSARVHILETWSLCGDVRLDGIFKTQGLFGGPGVTEVSAHPFPQDSQESHRKPKVGFMNFIGLWYQDVNCFLNLQSCEQNKPLVFIMFFKN